MDISLEEDNSLTLPLIVSSDIVRLEGHNYPIQTLQECCDIIHVW